ncbi:MAG: PVC-type heme-binding CxxCH protein [Planctomycetota bacterium]
MERTRSIVGAWLAVWASAWAVWLHAPSVVAAASPTASSNATNTQRPGDEPTSAENLVKGMTLPVGFRAVLFASEPDVSQPIAMTTDERGRLWVVENYSYPEWRESGTDRVVIFEDADGDGRFDSRTVFLDGGRNLTGIEVGYGGVWLTSPPQLLFVADRDRDDVPDGAEKNRGFKSETILDGFNAKEVGHNIVNGLRWGPDGWLYGRHGITATSCVGIPGSSDQDRTVIDCSIWRVHPVTRAFEVVTRGTTNPWGFDYDDLGEMVFTNNVIGHLWHVIPGAHYERMYGVDPESHVYEFMPQCADHLHWPGGEWQQSREADGKQDPAVDALGGGHSHCGGMIYLGDMFPDRYRGQMFFCNTHGKRVNVDSLEHGPRGIVGHHEPDFLKAFDTWFRGIELISGPDGRVWIADWTDAGECHDHDGVHRTSGRIYTILYDSRPEMFGAGGQSGPGATPPRAAALDLSAATDAELVELQLHSNDWFCRHARRILSERHVAGRDLSAAAAELRAMAETHADPTRRLRGLWAAQAVGAASPEWLCHRLSDPHESVRAWGVRLLVDRNVGTAQGQPDGLAAALVERATVDPSGLVRLHLAGALGKVPTVWRWEIATQLAMRPEDADWNSLALMIWYGLREAVIQDPARAVQLAASTPMPTLRRLVARRLAFDADRLPAAAEALCKLLAANTDADEKNKIIEPGSMQRRVDSLTGMAEALRGRRRVVLPESLVAATNGLIQQINDQMPAGPDAAIAQTMAAILGKEKSFAELRAVAMDPSAPVEARWEAIAAIGQSRTAANASEGLDAAEVLSKLLDDRSVRGEAVRALAGCATPKATQRAVQRLPQLAPSDRHIALDWIVRRPDGASLVLDAIESKKLAAGELSASQARVMHDSQDAAIAERLVKLWGTVRESSADRMAAIEQWRSKLSSESLAKADRSQGRVVWQQRCAGCHMLFGGSGRVGPDLTGSGRADLEYVLVNVIDPSAIVPEAWRLTQVITSDGRVAAGALVAADERTLTLRTPEGDVVFDQSEVDEVRKQKESVMPEGLWNGLTDAQVRDLVAYLASPVQVALPDE